MRCQASKVVWPAIASSVGRGRYFSRGWDIAKCNLPSLQRPDDRLYTRSYSEALHESLDIRMYCHWTQTQQLCNCPVIFTLGGQTQALAFPTGEINHDRLALERMRAVQDGIHGRYHCFDHEVIEPTDIRFGHH